MHGPSLSFALLLLLAASASAQETHAAKRAGFWIGFGAGYGSAQVYCCVPPDDPIGLAGAREARGGGPTAFVRFGATLSRTVRLGGELSYWTRVADWIGHAAVVLYDNPDPASGFFLKVGLGAAQFKSHIGPGLLAGFGYDARIGNGLFLTPVATVHFGYTGQVDLEGGFGKSDQTESVVEAGIGITFRGVSR